MGQTVHDPTDESLLSRVLTPTLLLAPLTIGLLLFGIIYGWRSSQTAAELDAQAPFLVIDSPDGFRVAPDRLCPDARDEAADLTFDSLDLDDPSRKSSISGLGFDRGVIDVKGWLEEPTGDAEPANEGGTTAAASDPAAQDSRDDITLELRRSDGTWCVDDVVGR